MTLPDPPDALAPRQVRFVEEYLIDLNATQAAIRAGYSKKTAQEQGSRLLSNVMVASALEKAMAERAARAGQQGASLLINVKVGDAAEVSEMIPVGITPPAPSPPPFEAPFEEVWQRYLGEMVKGRTMRDISTDPGMPSPPTILLWVRNSPQRAEQYARAREDQMTLLLEDMQEVADDGSQDFKEVTDAKGQTRVVFDREHVQRSKLRVEAMCTRIEKMAPKVYGPKVDVTSDGKKLTAPKTSLFIFGQWIEL